MSKEWYYIANNAQWGPVSTRGLTRAASNGTLRPSDLVWREGLPEWTRADQLKWLAITFPREHSEKISEVNYPAGERANNNSHVDTRINSRNTTPATLLDIWDGELSLALTFWGLGVVFGTFAFLVFGFLMTTLPVLFGGIETTGGAWLQALLAAALNTTLIFISVSIWRSAGKSSVSKLWKRLARAAVVPFATYATINMAALVLAVGIAPYS